MLRIKCFLCEHELTLQGALIFGPPDTNGWAKKYHVCANCWSRLVQVLENGRP